MAHTYTTSFVVELTDGVHDLDTDTLKIALYDANATIGPSVTAYSTTDEVVGTGYTAGGQTLVLSSGYPMTADNGVGRLYKFEDVEWTSATFTARSARIYNASKANRSIMVLDFSSQRQAVASTFAVRFPAALPALIRIGG